MKIELEERDICAIADQVFQRLQPVLAENVSNESNDRLFTKKQLSEYIGLSVSWVSNNKHRLPQYNIGDKPLYRKSEIDTWIESHRVLTPDKINAPIRKESNVVDINRKSSRRKSIASFKEQKKFKTAS